MALFGCRSCFFLSLNQLRKLSFCQIQSHRLTFTSCVCVCVLSYLNVCHHHCNHCRMVFVYFCFDFNTLSNLPMEIVTELMCSSQLHINIFFCLRDWNQHSFELRENIMPFRQWKRTTIVEFDGRRESKKTEMPSHNLFPEFYFYICCMLFCVCQCEIEIKFNYIVEHLRPHMCAVRNALFAWI